MDLHFRPMTEADARSVLSWRYDEPYDFYNNDPAVVDESVPELLDGPSWVVEDQNGALIGFFIAGLSGQVPGGRSSGVYERYPGLDIGLGMRPDLTGRGYGPEFFQACVDFARRELGAEDLRLSVATFNERAIKVYERAGFRRGPVFRCTIPGGDADFLLMVSPDPGRPA